MSDTDSDVKRLVNGGLSGEVTADNSLSLGERFRAFINGKLPEGTFKAAFRNLPVKEALQQQQEQIFDLWRSEEYWRLVSKRYVPDLGIGFTTSPYMGPWEYIWGVTPVEDYSKYKSMYTTSAYIHSAIDAITHLSVSNGFQFFLDGKDKKKVVPYLQKWCRKNDIINLLRLVVADMVVFGCAYVEIVRLYKCDSDNFADDRLEQAVRHQKENPSHKVKGKISWLKPIPPETMRVNRDPWGSILGYTQVLVFPPVHFLPQEIIFFRYNAKSWNFESAYGISMLRSLLRIQALIKEFEDVIGAAMWSYNYPKYVVKVGGVPGQPQPTPDQFNQVIDSFARRGPNSDIYIRHGGLIQDVQVIEPPTAPLEATQWWLDYLTGERAAAMGVPEMYLGKSGGTSRAAGDTISQEFASRLKVIQGILSNRLDTELFKPLVREKFGKDVEVPETRWNAIFDEPSDLKIAKAVQVYTKGLSTLDESRIMAGMHPLDPTTYGDLGKKFSPLGYPQGIQGPGEESDNQNMLTPALPSFGLGMPYGQSPSGPQQQNYQQSVTQPKTYKKLSPNKQSQGGNQR